MLTTFEMNLATLRSVDPHYKPSYPFDTMPSVQWVQRFVLNWEDWIMPAKARAKKNEPRFPEITFINRRLSKAESAYFTEWRDKQGQKAHQTVSLFMADGHKTSITYDFDNECYIAASTCKDEHSPNYNCCLTSRSDDWFEAMLMNAYKHIALFGGGEWEKDEVADKWG